MTTKQPPSVQTLARTHPYWKTEPCPAWCDNLHEDSDFVDDRRHMSDWSAHIVLTTEEPTIVERTPAGDGPWYVPFELVARLDQHVRDAAPLVIVHEAHCRIDELHLTPSEARQLGEALIRGADLAAGDSKAPAANPADPTNDPTRSPTET
ncbi:DUF6907 domain-containing protein [Kibdelosporangium persicum]|uniref:DUF6907 domain-containing protein n=1 Tax=Kibdelosporangium persicum TaxID=2698649 RepID=UPI00156734F0|nr:hypothetical protein [Kibdelosporangium persicum]